MSDNELLLAISKMLDEKLTTINDKLQKVENDVTDIKLTIENEIRTNIQRVAEGHLDLSRNLQAAIRTNLNML